MTGKALEVQCLYVLSNLQSWRGPLAREAKAVLIHTHAGVQS